MDENEDSDVLVEWICRCGHENTDYEGETHCESCGAVYKIIPGADNVFHAVFCDWYVKI